MRRSMLPVPTSQSLYPSMSTRRAKTASIGAGIVRSSSNSIGRIPASMLLAWCPDKPPYDAASAPCRCPAQPSR